VTSPCESRRDVSRQSKRSGLLPAAKTKTAVDFITSRAGTTHPVVWVPSHGGPDEAVQPVILGLAATILLLICGGCRVSRGKEDD
jgi:hypothetical protein